VLVVALTAIGGLVLLTITSVSRAAAPTKAKAVGAVYTETNGSPNRVITFARYANGSLKQRQVINTGGTGGHQQQPGCTPTCPILDTQGEVNLTQDGKLLFAVNAGSNTVTSFRVTSHGLKRVGVVSSGGVFPNSLTSHGNLLYVLNSNSLNIQGYRFSSGGKLTPVKGSKQSLTPAAPGFPRQVGFDSTGRVLIVTLLVGPGGPTSAAHTIDTFPVKANGSAGSPTVHDSTTPLPFGFALSAGNRLVVSQIHDLSGAPNADTASYDVFTSGAVHPVDTQKSGGFAACWVVISGNSRYVYVVNTGGGAPSGATVSAYTMSASGKLKLIQVTPVLKAASGKPEFARTDEILSSDGRYLYVLTPAVMSNTSRIDIYKVVKGGKLKLLGVTPSKLPAGVSGLAGL
jgi:6-phosphogluconolactonase (cycloisomerase 2 family)